MMIKNSSFSVERLADRKTIFQSRRCDNLKHFTQILNQTKDSNRLNYEMGCQIQARIVLYILFSTA